MLTQNSINSAHALAAIVTRKGKVLGVKPDSALADLLASRDCLNEGFEGMDDEEPMAPEATVLAQTSVGDDHAAEMDRVVDLASRAVAFTMDVARNKVTPKVKQVVELTEKHIDAHRSRRLEPLLIEPEFVAPVFESIEMHDLIGKFERAPQKDVPPIVLTAKWADDAGLNPLMTGIESFDGDVARHFAGREEQAKGLWIKYFSNEPGNYRNHDLRVDLQSLDDSLVVFLGANQLLESENVPEGLSVSLASYRGYLAELKEQSGSHIAYQLGRTKTSVDAKQLVIRAPRTTRPGDPIAGVIKVHGPVYNQWLAEGGSPEALCGAVAQGRPLDYTNSLESVDDNSAAWQRQLTTLNAQAAFELRAVTIQGLKIALLAVGNDIPDGEKVIDGDMLVAAAEARLAKLTNSDLENLYQIAQTEVCDLFYHHTDAKNFLEAMNSSAHDRPGMDIREVALLVALDYVTGWVADAIVVSDAE